MNFKQYFTESTSWKREKYIGTHHKKIEPIEPHLTKYEKELLNKWRETLQVGDRVDLIDKRSYMPGIMAANNPIVSIQRNSDNIPSQRFIIFIKNEKENNHLAGEAQDFYPPGYMPGDMTKGELSSDTLNTFGDIIDEL